MWEWISRAWSRGNGSRFGGGTLLGVREKVVEGGGGVGGGIGGRVVYRSWVWGSWIRRKGFRDRGVSGRIVGIEGLSLVSISWKLEDAGGIVEGEVMKTRRMSKC